MTYPKSQSKLVEELKLEPNVAASLSWYPLHTGSGFPPKALSFFFTYCQSETGLQDHPQCPT